MARRSPGDARELCAEFGRIVRVLKARCCANDLKSLRRNIQPVPEPSEQKTYLRTGCAAIQVRFVKHDQKFLAGLLASQSRVLSKIGRSMGRISMYSSIE